MEIAATGRRVCRVMSLIVFLSSLSVFVPVGISSLLYRQRRTRSREQVTLIK